MPSRAVGVARRRPAGDETVAGYVQSGRLPNKWWYAALAFLIFQASAMTVFWTPFAAVMYVYPVFLYLLGWGKTEDDRPAGRMPG